MEFKEEVDLNFELSNEIQTKLQDLSLELREVTRDKEGCFYKYCSREEIGNKILADFLRRNKDGRYEYSDEYTEEGLISELQALQTLDMIMEDFNAGDEKENEKLIIELASNILNKVDKGNGMFQIDASPFLEKTTLFRNDFHYLDTASWLASGCLSIFRLYLNGGLDEFGDTNLKRAKVLFQYTIKYINDCFIDNTLDASLGNDKKQEDRILCGWNFTKGCQEPSLYFSYIMCEVFLDIFNTFETVIKKSEIDFVTKKIDQVLKAENESQRIEILSKKRQINEEIGSAEKRQMDDEEFIKAELFFSEINGGKLPYEEGSLYAELEEKCKLVARNIWNVSRDKIASNFFSSDLSATVPEKILEQSISSDALFNTVFIINIIIDSGLDEDIDDKIKYYSFNGSSEYKEAISEFDDMRAYLQAGYDYVYRTYERLRRNNNEYRVNDYVLAFGERNTEYAEEVKELRKARIRVFSLLPMLVKTKTLISNFMIMYPQYDMPLYLEIILQQRMSDENNKYLWLWEKDGYSLACNYYYVSAVKDFYDYYDEYEAKYIANANQNEIVKKKIEQSFMERLQLPDGEIGQLRQKLRNYEKDIESKEIQIGGLRAQIDKLEADPVRKALIEMVREILKESITDYVKDVFVNISENITPNSLDDRTHPEVDGMDVVIKELIFSLISERIHNTVVKDIELRSPGRRDRIKDDYEVLKTRVKNDFGRIVDFYLERLIDVPQSIYVETNGYKGLRNILDKYSDSLRK